MYRSGGLSPLSVRFLVLFQSLSPVEISCHELTAHPVCAVGAPLDVPQIDNPSPADVDKWHAAYLKAVTELFNQHKIETDQEIVFQ